MGNPGNQKFLEFNRFSLKRVQCIQMLRHCILQNNLLLKTLAFFGLGTRYFLRDGLFARATKDERQKIQQVETS